jgi:hypothetical protein
VAGLQRRHTHLGVLWLDAHGDFNTPAISTSAYVGGMAPAMLTGRTPGLFDDTLGLRPVPRPDRGMPGRRLRDRQRRGEAFGYGGGGMPEGRSSNPGAEIGIGLGATWNTSNSRLIVSSPFAISLCA